MPVTAKLSSEFYNKFGDKIVDEFVNWFNQVDAAYRAEVKDLFEVHFSRFDAKLEQRWAQLDAKLEQRLAESDARWERRMSDMDAKWEHRMSDMDDKWEHRISDMDTKWERRMAESDVKWEQRFALFDVKWERRAAELKTSLILWMFGFWTASTFITLGTALAVLKL